MLQGKQFAIEVDSVDRFISYAESGLGLTSWVRDYAKAVILFDERWRTTEMETGIRFFDYDLAFNYDFMPGREFEIIRFRGGSPLRFNEDGRKTLRFHHVGIDVPPDIEFDRCLDSNLAKLNGSRVEMIATTVSHASDVPSKFYQYAYVSSIGMPFLLKVVGRLKEHMPVGEIIANKESYYKKYGIVR